MDRIITGYLFRELELSFQFGDLRPVLDTSAVPRAFHFFPNKIGKLSGRRELSFHQKSNLSANLDNFVLAIFP
jgi:hypothetical protein